MVNVFSTVSTQIDKFDFVKALGAVAKSDFSSQEFSALEFDAVSGNYLFSFNPVVDKVFKKQLFALATKDDIGSAYGFMIGTTILGNQIVSFGIDPSDSSYFLLTTS